MSNVSRRSRPSLKREMTSFDVAVIVRELNQTVKYGRIENIYQTGSKVLLLRLHMPNQPAMQLLVEAGKRVHQTVYVQEKPLEPPVFCMTLRKYLNGSTIVGVEQHEFERSITFKIHSRQGVMQLFVELFGDGNIILTSPQGAIVAAMTYKKMRDRNIHRNEQFQQAPPSGRNPLALTRVQLDELKNHGALETVRGLARFLSIGGTYAEEVLLRANLDKNIPCEQLSPKQIDAIFNELQTILSVLREGEFNPVIVINEEGDWVDATPIRLKRYEELKNKPCSSFNQALDEYFSKATHVVRLSEAREEYQKELARQQRMLQEQQRTLEDAQRAIEQHKRAGDIIYSHLGELQLLQQQIADAKQMGESWEQIINRLQREKQSGLSPAVYLDSLNPKNLILNICIDNTVFPVQMKRSVQANAAEHYEKMKKAERKLEGSEKATQETQSRIEELEKKWIIKAEETRVETPVRQVKKDWYEKFRWFVSTDGFLVIGGRDAVTNEILIKKHLEPHDIVFHADIVGAPFVIIKTESKPPTAEVIQEAAMLAASYSRAWREMLGAVDVFWVHPNQVSKRAPTGQYVEKGAFIIQGAKNYVRKVPLRVAIGLQRIGEQLRVIGGPTEAIRKHTGIYVEIVPGNEPSAKLAKQLRRLFSERVEKKDRESVLKVPIEEIQQFIPLGKGAVFTGKK